MSIASFQVEEVFALSDRGTVVAGQVREGEVRVGASVVAVNDEELHEPLVNKAVEFLDHISERKASVALQFANDSGLDRIRDVVPVGAVLTIA